MVSGGGDYASYIVPAAFILILQQMLLIGASLLTVVALAQHRQRLRDRARPRRCAPDHLSASTRVLLHRAAALLWILHTRPAAAIVCAGIGVRPGDQLHGPDGWRLVQSSRNARRGLWLLAI